MTNSSSTIIVVDDLALDPSRLSPTAINAVRAAFGLSGVLALVLGIVLLVWPDKTLAFAAIIFGINFIFAGLARLALSIFTTGISAGARVLGLLFGILLVILGVVAIKNAAAVGETLVVVIVVVIGIGWIIQGVLTLVESGRSPSRGWAITFGLISILAGIIILAAPALSASAFILLTGIVLSVLGLVGIVHAFTFGRGAAKAAI